MENRCGISRNRDPPSFSSTLLDSIYRSIDGSGNSNSEAMRSSGCCPERSARRNRGVGEVGGGRSRDRDRDRIVGWWMEKTATRDEDEFAARRRYSPAIIPDEFSRKKTAVADDARRSLGSVKMKSSSMSSSDSSSGFGFSSSDNESFAGSKQRKKSLPPIRTNASNCSELPIRPLTAKPDNFSDRKSRHSDRRPDTLDGSGGRRSAKSRAMKIYGDLKRIKQPISPGGKLANFLNSLFPARINSKKQRISTSIPDFRSNFTPISTPACSTASPYTRSCLIKSPHSTGAKPPKRSVRFCSVNDNADLAVGKSKTDPTVESERKSVEEAAMDVMRNYCRKWEAEGGKEVEMVDEDVESCCSADLFELENLMEIGVDRYCAELPVYETTLVRTNRAIASGLIV